MPDAGGHGAGARRVLCVQATEPAGYPPLINASSLMAEAGWDVMFLSAPIAGNNLELPRHPRIRVKAIPVRPSHVMGRAAYCRYIAAAVNLALRWRPDVVYASDPLGAAPGLLAARLARARLVYHEHDTPAPGALHPWLARARASAARQAAVVVFPNAERAEIARAEIGFPRDRLRIVWNTPRMTELPPLGGCLEPPLLLYHHGNISPHRVPETLVEALSRYRGCVRLRLVGREAPGAAGYVRRLLESGQRVGAPSLIEYCGQVSRGNLMRIAAEAHVGLALIGPDGGDVNVRHMAGAANRPFDYMAARLALLVCDLEDWRDVYVLPGYARACDPADPASIATALGWFLDHPDERRRMGARGQAKIANDWNYDQVFQPVIDALYQGAEAY